MKNIHVILFCITLTLCFSCKKEEQEPVVADVVIDYEPVESNEFRTNLTQLLRNAKSDRERDSIMAANGTRLTTQLVSFLRRKGFNCQIDSIQYHYGTGTAEDVQSGDGNRYSGKFESQPYATISGPCFQKGLSVFILCFNGTFSLNSDDSRSIGRGNQIFTIEPGRGINHYVDYETSIWLAEFFNLTLYKGKGWQQQNEITPDEALELYPNLDRVQVTVRVHPGDTFDLGRMVMVRNR